MTLGLEARRYIAAAVEEFGSAKQRGDWVQWEHGSTDGGPSPSICAIAVKALYQRADMLNERINAGAKDNENDLATVIADLEVVKSLIRSLNGVAN